VLLRAVLGLRKAGFRRIVIVTGNLTKPFAERLMRRSGRLPDCVEWFECAPGGQALPDLIANLTARGAQRLVFVAADTTYHSGLLQSLGTWNCDNGGAVLKTESVFARACVLSTASTQAFSASLSAAGGSAASGSMEQLECWLAEQSDLDVIAVPATGWQRICGEHSRLTAERKLDSWLVKPTDGIFARFNRRISIPISRQLIRFPITPNMVSLFTLGVSFMAGVCFAMGDYRNMVLGALLGVFASILDGCDGEVARLKLQESEFGCWLETVCDYLYYLFMFAGMTIGLSRGAGGRGYLYLGALLVFGAVMSFVTTSMQRVRLTAAGRPEQLLGNWQREAERRRSNPFIYLARHTEFIVRRCFLPYAILFFAVFNISSIAFILSVAGANVVWPIALYSYLTFPTPRTSAA
jgi:phosphatidylglycerophosphate synthase